MLYREIIAACSESHTKHINTVCGQNVELLDVKLVIHIVTTGPKKYQNQLLGKSLCLSLRPSISPCASPHGKTGWNFMKFNRVCSRHVTQSAVDMSNNLQ